MKPDILYFGAFPQPTVAELRHRFTLHHCPLQPKPEEIDPAVRAAARRMIWSLPVGVVSLIGTRTLRRLMRRELNSEVSSSELLMERGVVTVSIGAGELGKVRIKLGDVYVERCARAAAPEVSIHAGTAVRVTDVTDECVYVEAE